jgi:hypothetical protein
LNTGSGSGTSPELNASVTNVSNYAVNLSTNVYTAIGTLNTSVTNVSNYAVNLSTRTNSGISSLNTSLFNLSNYVTTLNTGSGSGTSPELNASVTNISNYVVNLSTNSNTAISSLNTSLFNLSNYVTTLNTGGGGGGGTVGPNVSFTNASVISLYTNDIHSFAPSDVIDLYTTTTGKITIGSNTATVNIGTSGANASLTVYGPIAGSTITSTSDYRLKENIKYNVSLDITSLKPCYYNFVNNPEHKIGFIAHEVQEVIPQAVIGVKDAIDHDSIIPQRIDYNVISAASVHAIQQLMKKVELLEERIRVLENK